jgi:hypothetical protein
MKQLFLALISILLLQSCFGDKKPVNIQELGDTSFVNKNFKGNLINYAEGMSACAQLSASAVADLYGASAEEIHIEDPTKSDRYQKGTPPVCGLYLKSGDNDFEWLRGSIALQADVAKEEQMSEVAEAVGRTENWEEAWSLKKSMSKSAEWVDGLGLAALWFDQKNQLEIKFEGYTLVVNPLKNIANKKEVAANRDYKKVAIGMAKAAGYIK